MGMYALHVLTGEELEIRRKLTEYGYLAIVPEEIGILRRQRESIQVRRVVMPGYVFVDEVMTAAAYYDITGVSGVIRMLNYGDPMPDNESELIYRMSEMADDGVTRLRRLSDGTYEILDGALRGLEGRIIHVDRRQHKLTIGVDICGRSTEVTLSAVVED